ncbi:hypothetical protein F7725_010971, partial [Dissostichus mawsoni]
MVQQRHLPHPVETDFITRSYRFLQKDWIQTGRSADEQLLPVLQSHLCSRPLSDTRVCRM